MSEHSVSVEKVQQDNDVELEQETKVNKQGDTPDEAGKADEQHRTDNVVDENDIDVEVESHDDESHDAHSIDNITPYKLHSLMDKYPKCSFCIALGLFLISGVIVVALAQTGNLLSASSDVPMYIRDEKAYEARDALIAGQLDASYEPRGVATSTLQQSVSADVHLKLLYILNDDEDGNGLMQTKCLSMMDELEYKLSILDGYNSKCKKVYNGDTTTSFKCVRYQTVTQFFDTNYFIGATDQTYDAYPSFRNFRQYLAPSHILNNTKIIPNKNYTRENIDKITNYWSGYGEGMYNDKVLPFKFYYSVPNENGDGWINNSLANVFKTITDNKFGETPISQRVSASMSIFSFGLPLNGYASHIDNVKQQEDLIGEWCYSNLDDILSQYADKFNAIGITLRWDCATMRSYAILALLAKDAKLLILTFLSVFLLMIYNVNSVFLAIFGMLMIFLNFLPSILLYRYISQLSYFGTLNMLGMFIILAIGADDIFVLYDTWAQTRIKYPNKSVARRLTFTLNHAAKVMATTSLSTIFSFIGNTTSKFPAVYTFGAFSAWLVFVNYCAVVLFYPTVLVIHDKYFYTPNLKRPWCYNKNCSIAKSKYDIAKGAKTCYNVKLNDEMKQRRIDQWFEDVYYCRFIRKFKHIILIIFGLILLLFGYYASGLEPDPNVPQIFPSGTNYQEYRSDLSSHFATENAFQMTNYLIFGLKGIDRSGTDATLIDDIGSPIYDEKVSFALAEEQQYIAQVCDDLLCGYKSYDCRYKSIWSDLKVINPDETFGSDASSDIKVVKCFMTEFRQWVQTEPVAKLNRSAIIHIVDEYNLDINASVFDECVFDGTFPVQYPQCFGLLFAFVWMNQEIPTSNPDYSAGTTNYDYWKEYIWATKQDVSPVADALTLNAKVRFIQISILLDLYANTAYTEGIYAYGKWEEYVLKWRDNTDGSVSMDKYSNDFVKTPSSLKSMSFTDVGKFAYFFLQKQIIGEAFVGIFLSLTLALIVLIFATNNYIISLMCVFVIFCIVVCVIGFTVLMGWKLGVIEAIIFVLVVGMSVDYVVHLSEAYLSSKKYFKSVDKAKSMLGIVGGSVLSGGLSTIIGVSWLCLADIGLLNKFGITILFLITTSLLYALCAFSAFVSVFGPNGNKGNVFMIFLRCYKSCNCCQHRKNGNLDNKNINLVEIA